MTFLHPLLLIAAAGVALPILAHLLNRFQVNRTDWAAMAFLNRSVRVRSRPDPAEAAARKVTGLGVTRPQRRLGPGPRWIRQ